ncbi:Tn3 family transposase [Streptomyces hygroscopicus]|uniref:Tn3 family transposase n=1 Tax=Streptomyces hygroscopicus TaxID=1912 RepID=UPI003626F300
MFGFRECAVEDQAQLAEWLTGELCGVELSRDRLAEAVVARCRKDRLEPPAPAKVTRLVASAVKTFEERFCRTTTDRLSAVTRSRLDDLVAEEDGEGSEGGGRTFFTELKADPGALGLESLLTEVNKLQRVRQPELPPELFGDVSEKLVSAWRARAAKEYPSDLLAASDPVRYTLLATLCHVRQTEITDSLVDLFIQLVQKINTRAEKKVEGEFVKELKKVRGKEGMMLRVAEAALAEPGGTVRKVIFPVVGEKTLKALAAEAAANEARYKARIRTVLRSSYSNHWRRMLSPLLSVLELNCNNTAYRPVMDAIDLLKRYLDQPIKDGGTSTRPSASRWTGWCPSSGGRRWWTTRAGWSASRTSCACWSACGTRCGAGRSGWPARAGGATRRTTCRRTSRTTGTYTTGRSRQPLDPGKFIDALQKRLREALTRFDTALQAGTTGGVEITRKHGEPWIKVSPLGKQEEPENLVALKAEIERRWGMIDLIDILKEAEFATGFIGEFASVASREALPREVLRRRLLLVLFALGTNMGIKRVAVTGKHGESEAVLRRIRHLFVNRTNLRGALVKLVNATFAVRDAGWWGEGTSCASDSKKFGSWSSNFMTEWHQRYRGPGVMIYWQCDLKAAHIEQATGRRYRRFRPVTNWSIPQSACGGSNPSVRSLAIRPKAEKTTGSVRVRGKSGRMNTSEPLTRTRKDHPPQWELSRWSRSYRVRTPARLRTPTVTAGVGHRGSRVREGIHPGRISRVWNRETPQKSLWVGRRQRRLNSSAGKGWSEKRMPPRRKARGKTG